jgi:hypothetical protein
MIVKRLIKLLFLMPLFMVLIGCGRKGPPSLPRKPSSLIWKLETGNLKLDKEESLSLKIDNTVKNSNSMSLRAERSNLVYHNSLYLLDCFGLMTPQ